MLRTIQEVAVELNLRAIDYQFGELQSLRATFFWKAQSLSLSGLSGILASAPGISNIVHASSAKNSMASTSPAVSAPREDTQRYTDYLDFQCFKAHIIW